MNLVCFAKPKLMFTDGLLPVLMEIKSVRPDARIDFLVFSQRDLTLLRQNRDIWDGFLSIGCEPSPMFQDGGGIDRVRYLLRVLRRLTGRNILISASPNIPYGKYVIPVLQRTSRLTTVRHYHNHTPSRGLSNFAQYLQMCNARHGRTWRFDGLDGEYDYVMSQISGQQYREILGASPAPDKTVHTGYVQRMPAWQSFLRKRIEQNSLIHEKPYVFFVLSHLGVSRDVLEEPPREVLFREALQVLSEYGNRLRVILKPHPNTPVDRVRQILREEAVADAVIDYSHPMVLASNAICLIGNVFSTVMNDAFFYGRPVIEYSHRDAELIRRVEGGSTGGDSCDFYIHHDQQKLKDVMDGLLSGRITVARDPQKLIDDYPLVPDSFHSFWRGM